MKDEYTYKEALEVVEDFMIDSGIREYCEEICRGYCCGLCSFGETHVLGTREEDCLVVFISALPYWIYFLIEIFLKT